MLPPFDNDPDFNPYAGLPEPSTTVKVMVWAGTTVFAVLVLLAVAAAFLRMTGV